MIACFHDSSATCENCAPWRTTAPWLPTPYYFPAYSYTTTAPVDDKQPAVHKAHAAGLLDLWCAQKESE